MPSRTQIRHTQLFFSHKIADAGHFGWPKITFNRIFVISNQYATKSPTPAILHDQKSPSIAFLTILILDQYSAFNFRIYKMAYHFGWPKITFDRIFPHLFEKKLQNGRRRPFWMTENHFRSHFSPFYINKQLLFFGFFYKMAPAGHFGWPKITFDRISRHFRSIRNLICFEICSQNGCRRPFWMTENHFQSHFSTF